MIVSIHQPHFLPWLGYLDRMRHSDLFVVLDHVQFERQNYQNRVSIKTGQGSQWIVVPVVQNSRSETIIEKRIDNQGNGRHHWVHRLCKTVEHAYHGAPCFSPLGLEFQQILKRPWDKLVDLNLALLDWLRAALGIHTPMMRSSELGVSGQKAELVLEICQATGASVFLGGLGASRAYIRVEEFERAGIGVAWQRFAHPRYRQHPRPRDFVEGLSALDLLFNYGPASAGVLSGSSGTPGAVMRGDVTCDQ